jgi:glutamyl-tRNA synthetase
MRTRRPSPPAGELAAACAIAQDKAQTLEEVWPLIRFLFEPPVDDPHARQKFLGAESRAALARVREALAAVDPFEPEALERDLGALVDELGLKPKAVYQPLRVAITGTTVSPGIFDSVAALGRERALERLDAVIAA